MLFVKIQTMRLSGNPERRVKEMKLYLNSVLTNNHHSVTLSICIILTYQSLFSLILWLLQVLYLNFLHKRSLKYRFKLSSSHLELKDNDFSIWPNDTEVWALGAPARQLHCCFRIVFIKYKICSFIFIV